MEGSVYGMKYVRKVMSLAKKNSRVLDIGCGSTGRTVDEALNHDYETTGIDVSSEMIRIAKQKHTDGKFIKDDFITWNSAECYDLIVAWDSLFHAPKNFQEKLTMKTCNLLNKDGILLFTAGGIDDERSGEMHGVSFEYGSLNYLDYLSILDESGLRIVLMESDQYPQDHMVFICQKK